MTQSNSDYQSYLLRLWRPDDRTAWRILLEHIHSGERQSFPDLGNLFEFLEGQVEFQPPSKESWKALSQ